MSPKTSFTQSYSGKIVVTTFIFSESEAPGAASEVFSVVASFDASVLVASALVVLSVLVVFSAFADVVSVPAVLPALPAAHPVK